MTDNRNLTVKHDNTPVGRLKMALSADSVQAQFKNALKENANLFVASLIDIYASDKFLQNCSPADVIMEALKAATLKLPINKSLGFAYIVPYKNKKAGKFIPTMIVGYKGYLQLAQRTGQYKFINADAVYEGERIELDRLTGEVFFSGQQESDKAIGYFAHIETISGFRKTIFWTKEQVQKHAEKYSQAYHSEFSPWRNQFDGMAIKTVLRHLLTKYGVMSVDMIGAVDLEQGDFKDGDRKAENLIEQKSAGADYTPTEKAPDSEPEPGKVVELNTQPDIGNPAEIKAQNEENETVLAETSDNLTEITEEKHGPAEWADEWGTPVEHPLAKPKWWSMRAGSFKDGTGFKAYIQQNRNRLKDISDGAFGAIFDKYQKIYSESLPWGRHGQILADNGQGIEESSTKDILDTAAAKQLAELATKHPVEYRAVVAGQVPQTMEQIVTWMGQINQMVVNARLSQSSN